MSGTSCSEEYGTLRFKFRETRRVGGVFLFCFVLIVFGSDMLVLFIPLCCVVRVILPVTLQHVLCRS